MRAAQTIIVSELTGKQPVLTVAHSPNQCLECRKKRAKRSKYCYKHAKRRYIARHYDRYIFNNLKQNAKKRRKDFQLTFSEFLAFCKETGYLEKKGQSPGSYTIDRKDHTIGYTRENIQVLTHAENSRKGFWEKFGYQNEDHYHYEHQSTEIDDPF